ncbi:alpha/beta hydrolase [Schumannella luteola]|uniref:Pimeloyl-ACP methyl ester carboxylesterase n=1 Tax=Schumannella luteola TaxID=472059 RepID=A0A852Y5I0_9MICO|nr:alpha/beta hydrolase [Schumannella luteola]NYG98186.1 pimeloyl-ACP methyl ester carboxylesterase [Schumannella luteola]TPW90478.1 alpha/beta hydrolase [Schumannella luteola]
MPTVTTAHAEIEYVESGRPDGPAVVLLHGFPDGPRTWDAVVGRLPSDARVIRPLLRGVGGSRSLDGTITGQIAALADDVLGLVEALELRDVVLVGHDWGARAAHAAAVLAPDRVRSLITLATAYGPRTELTAAESLDDAAVAWYRYWLCTEAGATTFRSDPHPLLRWSWDHWSPAGTIPDAERAELLALFATPQFAETVVHYYRHGAGEAAGDERYAAAQRLLDTWPAIEVPTTFFVGTEDGCETLPAARAAASSFANGYDLVELDGVGHFVQREAPDAVAEAIRAALAG